VALLGVTKAILVKKGIAVNLRSALPYTTVLFMIPALVVIVGAQADYFIFGVDILRRVSMILMPGVFFYTAGCILLFVMQAVHLWKMKERSKMPNGITAWIAKNRIDIAGATLLITFILFTLVRYVGAGSIYLLSAKVTFMDSPTPFAALLARFFELFPPILLLIPIGIDIALVAATRYRPGQAYSLRSTFASMRHNMIRWIAWMAAQFAVVLFLVLSPWYAPVLVTQAAGLDLGSFIFWIAYLFGGYAVEILMLLASFVLLAAPILWIADLVVSEPQRIRG
jgi:hypothetical protein